jgi:phosphohistidine phosphatase
MQESMQEPVSDVRRGLVLMRHAKAQPTAPSDHDRALATRGLADAEQAGRWLREQGIDPDGALVSDAVRAQQTFEQVAAGAAWDLEPELSAGLYDAGPDTAFDLIRQTDPDVATLVVIGHNPTMAYLAELVDSGDGDAEATTGMLTRGFPTSALAVFTVLGDWSGVGPGTGRLEAFYAGDA